MGVRFPKPEFCAFLDILCDIHQKCFKRIGPQPRRERSLSLLGGQHSFTFWRDKSLVCWVVLGVPYMTFLCRSGYFMQSLGKMISVLDPYLTPVGGSWETWLFVHIWTFHLIPSKTFFLNDHYLQTIPFGWGCIYDFSVQIWIYPAISNKRTHWFWYLTSIPTTTPKGMGWKFCYYPTHRGIWVPYILFSSDLNISCNS